MLRFLELSEGVLERCSDSTGTVIGAFERAARRLGPLSQAAHLEPETLAQHVAELLAGNTYGQFNGLVPALKDALGDWGLKLLGSYCRQRGARDGNPHLLQIAVARGDVDGYLAQFDAEDLRWRDIAASVAQHLMTSGRAEQALQVAEQHPLSLLGLHFLVEWGALARAARHVVAHEGEWDGDACPMHSAAAERLSADHPLAATLLLRPMVFFALWMGHAKRYRYAAAHLRTCEQLADRIADWQGHPDHVTYVERLYDSFSAKWGFWKLMQP